MHPLAQLEFSKRVAKRAQYEAFDISLCGSDILVRNESHANPANHEYTVTVEKGVPVSCSCPADSRFDGACKHRVAVAIRRSLLDTLAQIQDGNPPIAGDGGIPHPATESEQMSPAIETAETPNEDEQECATCLSDFPCWECYRTGQAGFE